MPTSYHHRRTNTVQAGGGRRRERGDIQSRRDRTRKGGTKIRARERGRSRERGRDREGYILMYVGLCSVHYRGKLSCAV